LGGNPAALAIGSAPTVEREDPPSATPRAPVVGPATCNRETDVRPTAEPEAH